jgi:hypothetical protein
LYPAVLHNPTKPKEDTVRQWEMCHLPYIMARFVAMAGLNQKVLDRSLLLMGYSVTNHTPRRHEPSHHHHHIPIIKPAQQLSRMDELLAIIAIACQLDPQWRNWIYISPINKSETTATRSIVHCDSRSIRNGPTFHQFLSFINQHILPDSDDPTDIRHQDSLLLPPKYISAMKSLSNLTFRINHTNIYTASVTNRGNGNDKNEKEDERFVIRPCRILAGAFAPTTVEIPNRTCKVPMDLISEHYHKKKKQLQQQQRTDRSEMSNNVVTTIDEKEHPVPMMKSTKRHRDETKEQIRKQNKNRKQQFRRNECDAMHALPNHDFFKADRCNNDWEVCGDIDMDQMRLIHYLGSVTNINPYHIRRSMNWLLQPPPPPK